MKLCLFLFCFIFHSDYCISQSVLDKSLSEVSNDLANKLKIKNINTIAVLYITDNNKSSTAAGKYLADIISVNIVNNPGNFLVFNRENLNSIVEAKKLIAEGYIDANDAKELGRLLSVEAIVIGNYTVLSNTIKLSLNCLDSNTGFVTAASMKDLPMDADAASLLGVSLNTANQNSASNMGFNRPINSNEQINNPETVNKECEKYNVGDYCFYNSTNDNFIVSINADGVALNLAPGQTQCLYNYKSGSYNYHVMGKRDFGRGQAGIYRVSDEFRHVHDSGQLLVEKCKSKTFIIK